MKNQMDMSKIMSLTAKEVQLIEMSYQELIQNELDLAKCFYSNLFEMAPLIKPMFKSDQALIELHFNKLIHSAVRQIHQFEQLTEDLFALGQQHRGYGVKAAQFEIVKVALLLSMEYQLKARFTEAIKVAWAKYIDLIAKIMVKGLCSE